MSEEKKDLIRDIAKRTIKTMLEVAGGLLATHATITSVPWSTVVNTVCMSGLLCIIVNVVAQIKTED